MNLEKNFHMKLLRIRYDLLCWLFSFGFLPGVLYLIFYRFHCVYFLGIRKYRAKPKQHKNEKNTLLLREIDTSTLSHHIHTHNEIKGGNKLNWKLKRTYSLTARQESLSNSIWKCKAHKHGFEATTTTVKTTTTTTIQEIVCIDE